MKVGRGWFCENVLGFLFGAASIGGRSHTRALLQRSGLKARLEETRRVSLTKLQMRTWKFDAVHLSLTYLIRSGVLDEKSLLILR